MLFMMSKDIDLMYLLFAYRFSFANVKMYLIILFL